MGSPSRNGKYWQMTHQHSTNSNKSHAGQYQPTSIKGFGRLKGQAMSMGEGLKSLSQNITRKANVASQGLLRGSKPTQKIKQHWGKTLLSALALAVVGAKIIGKMRARRL